MDEKRSYLDALKRRVLLTLLPAVIGGLGGYAYAVLTLSEEELRGTMLQGLYGAVGAALAIMMVRLISLVRLILSDFVRRGD